MDRDTAQARQAVHRAQGQNNYLPSIMTDGYNNNWTKNNSITSSPFASTEDRYYAYYDALNTKYQNKEQKIRTDRLRFVSRDQNDEF